MRILRCIPGLRTALASAVVVSLAACGAGSGGVGTPSPAGTVTTPEAAEKVAVDLKSFDSADPCGELKAYVSGFADDLARRRVAASGDSLDRPMPMPMPMPAVNATSAASVAGDTASATSSSASAFTTTNVQTAGIDELDNTKNNGNRLYRLSDNGVQVRLSKARYWPADSLVMDGVATVPSVNTDSGQRVSARGMFLTDNQQLVVMRSLDGWIYSLSSAAAVADLAPNAGGDAISASSLAATSLPCVGSLVNCVPGRLQQRVYIDLFDGSVSGAPVHQATLEVGGRLVDARRIGQHVWIVTQEYLQFPDTVRWWPAGLTGSSTPEAREAAMTALIEQNSAAIRSAPLSAWLPADLAREISGTPEQAATACRTVRRISEPTELGWLRITSLNLDNRAMSRQLVLADSNIVYASPRALYVATPSWRSEGSADTGPRTYLHKFAITSSGAADYAGSGAFAGQPLSAYSFDEDAHGVLRFASAAFRTPDESAAIRNWESYTYLGLISEQAGRLVVKARTPAIAPGERMQSARFVGPRAYLVTFRQIDPFFVYQMDAPGGPQQLGELKLPGFSTYLHPIGERHILGIGYADGGWPRQIKATLFDVGDPTRPREQAAVPLGAVYSASDAIWDPHAFNYLARTASSGVLAIPLWSYRYGETLAEQSSLKLVNVSAEQGLSLAGELSVNDLISAASSIGARPLYVRRSIMTPEHVFAVGDGVLRSASLAAPQLPLATLLGP